MDKILASVVVAFGVVIVFMVLSFLNAIFVSLLWNWLVPVLMPDGPFATTITYWQAWGVSFLCSTLFKGASCSGSDSSSRK